MRSNASGTRALLVASTSEGKLREIRDALAGTGVELSSLADIGWTENVPETGETFEENATMKAEAVCAALGRAVLADDSGLEVEALGWGPGVRSARFAGPGDEDRNRELVRLLRETGVPGPWRARYRCVLALARPGEATLLFGGSCLGAIVEEPRGTGGFGYDPHFLLPDRNLTVGEISLAEKQQISHRGEALAKLADWLKAEG